MPAELSWLPKTSDWGLALSRLGNIANDEERWSAAIALSHYNLDFVQTTKLDRTLQKLFPAGPPAALKVNLVKLALLGSSTLKHLLPGIRVAAIRRKLWLTIYEGPYGMYQQELMNSASGLYDFQPNVVCFALDAHHLAEGEQAQVDTAVDNLKTCWRLAKQAFGSAVIQQAALPVFAPVMGSNEHRFPDSPAAKIDRFNLEIQKAADAEGVHLLSVGTHAFADGLAEWHDAGLWHQSKQEIHPRVSQVYGDLLARVIAADRGLSSKCLVLDLDNTLWGGVIGDDGLEGILLGQGGATGEAFIAFQRYVLQLKRRGVILAVCSKNDEQNALSAFEKHPEMVLRRSDIACFVANWDDKASNLRHIAKALNIGLDSLVFVDDNPFERNLVRQEVPEVSVPELPEDPAFYIDVLARAGYFEGLTITDEDRDRSQQYQANAERESLRENLTDMRSYLQHLRMELIWSPFDDVSLSRVTQLINKTNQFNLTTQRYTEAQVRSFMEDPRAVTLQARLVDRFGDNGIIAILIALINTNGEADIDTWLMSCRVLGRQVEEACLNLLCSESVAKGATTLVGRFKPSAKNGMVKDHYARLAFAPGHSTADGATSWVLDLSTFQPKELLMTVQKGDECKTQKSIAV